MNKQYIVNVLHYNVNLLCSFVIVATIFIVILQKHINYDAIEISLLIID